MFKAGIVSLVLFLSLGMWVTPSSAAAKSSTVQKVQLVRNEEAVTFLQYVETAELQYHSMFGSFASYKELIDGGFMKRLPMNTLTLETASGRPLVGGKAPVPTLPTGFKLRIVTPSDGSAYSISIATTSGGCSGAAFFASSSTPNIHGGKPVGCAAKK